MFFHCPVSESCCVFCDSTFTIVLYFYLICLVVSLVGVFEVTLATLTMITKPYVVTENNKKNFYKETLEVVGKMIILLK